MPIKRPNNVRLDRSDKDFFKYDPDVMTSYQEAHFKRPIDHASYDEVFELLIRIIRKYSSEKASLLQYIQTHLFPLD